MDNKREIVPNWRYTEDDFLYTTLPYEELQEYAKNPFVHQRMVEAMARYAAGVGFKQLKKFYKAYLAGLKQSSAGGTVYVGGNPTCFEGTIC